MRVLTRAPYPQRKMKMKQLESMMEVESVEEDSELVMRFPRPFGVFDAEENLISVRDVSFSWPTEAGEEPQPPLFEGVDFTVGAKARIAILGKNGCGEWPLWDHPAFSWRTCCMVVARMCLAVVGWRLAVPLSITLETGMLALSVI